MVATFLISASPVPATFQMETKIAQISCVDVPAQTPARDVKVLTKEEWATLRPIIKRLYIDEDKTYTAVANWLRSERGFHPTKRQFTRKLDEWGLKKNFRKKEREEILLLGANNEKFAADHRVHQGRIKRMQKRYGAERMIHSQLMANSALSGSINRNVDNIGFVSNGVPSVRMLSNQQKSAIRSIAAYNGSQTEPGNPSNIQMLGMDWMQMYLRHIVPSCPTTTIDGLMELLSRMRIDVSGYDPRSDISEGYVEEEEDGDSIAEHGLDLRKGSSVTIDSYDSPYYPPSKAISSPIRIQKPNYTCSPYFELGVFPSSPAKRPKMSWDAWCVNVQTVWPTEIRSLEAKLDILDSVEPTDNKAKIQILERLDRLQVQMCYNRWGLKRILKARINEANPNEYTILMTYLEVVEEAIEFGNSREIAGLYYRIHDKIQITLDPEHPIHLRSSYLHSLMLDCRGQFEASENILRPVIQIALRQYGLKNKFTIKTLDQLAKLRHTLGDFDEAMGLSKFVVSAYGWDDAVWDYHLWLRSSREMMSNLRDKRLYDDAMDLCDYMSKYKEMLDGKDIRYHAELQRKKASILIRQGKLSEGLNILRTLLNTCCLSLGLRRRLYHEIGFGLTQAGEFRESAKYYEKCLELEIQLYGCQHPYVLGTCEDIGYCYEDLRLYGNALQFYQKVVRHFRRLMGVDHPSVREVERWIAFVQGKLAGSDEGSEDENMEIRDNEDVDMEGSEDNDKGGISEDSDDNRESMSLEADARENIGWSDGDTCGTFNLEDMPIECWNADGVFGDNGTDSFFEDFIWQEGFS